MPLSALDRLPRCPCCGDKWRGDEFFVNACPRRAETMWAAFVEVAAEMQVPPAFGGDVMDLVKVI